MKSILIVFLVTICAPGAIASSKNHYVDVSGSSSGDGTIANPWNLQTALNHPSVVTPGDTILVLSGLYTGVFSSRLRGKAGLPIIVRAAAVNSVVLDGNVSQDAEAVLSIEGQYTWYWGLTITNSAPTDGVNSEKDGVYFIGAENKLVNCLIHNNGVNGVGFWKTALNAEIYGCIIYHNGYFDASRGHGHGIYTQNETGTKLIRGNILFNSYGNGIQVYTEKGSIQGYDIDRNILFNSGLPGNSFIERNIIVGGLQPADRISINSNYIINRFGYSAKGSVQLGYSAENIDARLNFNTLIDGYLYVNKG